MIMTMTTKTKTAKTTKTTTTKTKTKMTGETPEVRSDKRYSKDIPKIS